MLQGDLMDGWYSRKDLKTQGTAVPCRRTQAKSFLIETRGDRCKTSWQITSASNKTVFSKYSIRSGFLANSTRTVT